MTKSVMQKGVYVNDNWSTPRTLYDKLNEEFNFDFDPCPICYDVITDANNGLLKDWGWRNFVNPPYSRGNKDAFINKAVAEMQQGKLSVLLIPVSTSTKLFHDVIFPNASEIRLVEKRIKFTGHDVNGNLVSHRCGMHDSMIVILDPLHANNPPILSQYKQ